MAEVTTSIKTRAKKLFKHSCQMIPTVSSGTVTFTIRRKTIWHSPKWLWPLVTVSQMTFCGNDSCSPPTVTPFVKVPKARIIWLWAITKYSPNLHDLSKPFPNTSISCYLPLDCFQVVAQRLCTELVCAHGHVLARGGGPSNQSQASGRARIDLSLQLLMPSDLSTGPVFTSPCIVCWLENIIGKI